jgi:hypothetical protein
MKIKSRYQLRIAAFLCKNIFLIKYFNFCYDDSALFHLLFLLSATGSVIP